MSTPDFHGLSILLLESRRSREMAALVTTYGGRPVSAPALREVPLASNPDALAFAGALLDARFDIVILLTGVGARALLEVVETKHPRDAFIRALSKTKVVARGPKPMAMLREWGVPAWVTVPEPNTWHELLAAVDDAVARTLSASAEATARPAEARKAREGWSGPRGEADTPRPTMGGMRVAVQEYGRSNAELLEQLEARGAHVTRVPVYRWALPEDVGPLRAAVTAIARGELEVVLFTTSVQVVHLMDVAAAMGEDAAVRASMRRMVVGSIGPTTTDELRHQGIAADLEASHPKMGFLVREAAERAPDLLPAKRRT
ncbi:MAG: hypothetical protein A3H29_05805 [Acidobacteria bacterium RIFCSPLOWO2_02_FULL_67_21]|nr:MAG: hypothetical protein A3H29_05805 [Acidobacteria bacterium RIFCSPLOWO2_02_FULL_67_21]